MIIFNYRWMEKEMTAMPTPAVSNKPLFFFMEDKKNYYRVLVEKIPQDKVKLNNFFYSVIMSLHHDSSFCNQDGF